jgi:hypothetical protein
MPRHPLQIALNRYHFPEGTPADPKPREDGSMPLTPKEKEVARKAKRRRDAECVWLDPIVQRLLGRFNFDDDSEDSECTQ